MREQRIKLHYPVYDNKSLEYEGEVYFPVNSVLAKTMQKNERVQVLLMKSMGGDNKSAINIIKFKDELDAINASIGAYINYKEITIPFLPSKDVSAETFRKIIGAIDQKSEIIADITYGPKPLPMVIFCALNFAEKYLGVRIKNIIYGKVEFKDNTLADCSQALFDITPLYYLNSLVCTAHCDNPETAMKIIDDFLAL
jgi:hypothetical protein